MEVTISNRRLPHIHVPGACYFLTFRMARTQASALSEEERTAMAGHIARMAPGTCRAWVVMPDHVHLLYQSAPDEVLSRTLKALKGSSSRTLCKLFGRVAPVWQDETYDHVVRNEREIESTWRYIEENPVRKALVTVPASYRWSSGWGRS